MPFTNIDLSPNRKNISDTQNDTNWHLLGSDGNVYASFTALLTAGVRPWPFFEPGLKAHYIVVRSQVAGGGAGSSFYVQYNSATVPGATDGELCDPTRLTLEVPAGLMNIWVKKTAGTDTIAAVAHY